MQTNDVLDALLRAWMADADHLESRYFDVRTANLVRRHATELAEALAKSADELLSLTEAAKLVGCSVSTIHRQLKAGKLQNHGYHSRPRVRRGDLGRRPSKHILSLTDNADTHTVAEARMQSARAAVTPFIRGGHG